MSERGIERFGASAAIVVGVAHAGALLGFLAMPALYHGSFVIAGLGGLAAVPALAMGARAVHDGWHQFAMALGYLGFALMARNHMADFNNGLGGMATDTMLAHMCIGVWIGLVSLFAMAARKMRRHTGILGLVVAAVHVLTAIAFGFCMKERPASAPLMMTGLLGSCALSTVWFIGLGLQLRHRGTV